MPIVELVISADLKKQEPAKGPPPPYPKPSEDTRYGHGVVPLLNSSFVVRIDTGFF